MRQRRLRPMMPETSTAMKNCCSLPAARSAAALAMNGTRVTMIFPSNGIGSRVYPQPLAAFLNSYYREKGVTLLASETVRSVRMICSKMIVITGNGREITADGVVAGLGIQPNTELAEQAGLKVDNGIVVDELL